MTGKVKAKKKTWAISISGGPIVYDVYETAYTLSEARSAVKRALGLRRLPVGTLCTLQK